MPSQVGVGHDGRDGAGSEGRELVHAEEWRLARCPHTQRDRKSCPRRSCCRIQRRRNFFGRRKSIGGHALQTAVENGAHTRRDTAGDGGDRWSRLIGAGGRVLEQRSVGEWQSPAGRDEPEDAERIDVAPTVQGQAHRLLGAHEVRRAHDPAFLIGVGRDARDAEVGDHRSVRAFLDENVIGLDVSMDDAATVRVPEGKGDVAENSRQQRRSDRPARPQPFAERLPAHEGHHEVRNAIRLAHSVDGHDVRVRERRRRAGLAQESVADIVARRHLGGQRLDRNEPVEHDLAREVDDPHAPAAELTLQGVFAGERRLQCQEGPVGDGWLHAP